MAGFSQSEYEKGRLLFDKRANDSEGLVANEKYINASIKHFEKANSPEGTVGLLRALEFKGSFVELSDKKRKKVYAKAIEIGKEALKQYPDNIGIKYYYVANLGRYGQTISKLNAHKEGITDEIRNITTEIIQENPKYAEAGALRILGAIHLKIPSVPFILDWPSNEKAKELLTRAYDIAPENPGNVRFYAELLIDIGQDEKAEELLRQLLKTSPRAHRLLEDKQDLEKAQKVYDQLAK
ncbi:MAG: hypothetical protein Tsb0034_20000 [Ekhidna sp.]